MEYDLLYVQKGDGAFVDIPVIYYGYLQKLIHDNFPKVAHYYESELDTVDNHGAHGCFYVFYVHRLTESVLDKNKYNSVTATVNRGCKVPFNDVLSLLAHRGLLPFRDLLVKVSFYNDDLSTDCDDYDDYELKEDDDDD